MEKFVCNQCGLCCKIFNMSDFTKKEEWERIVGYIIKKHGGILKISGQFDKIEEYKIESYNDLPIKALNRLWQCPFLKRERDKKGRFTSKYACEIHDVRPKVCRAFPIDREHARTVGCTGYD